MPGGSSPGGTGGGGALTPESVVPGLDGYIQTNPCGANDFTQYDCVNSGCTGNAKTVQRDFTVTGSASTVYELTIRVRGVIEAKNYTGGTRRAGTGAMDAAVQGGDFLYTGGSAPNSTYNEYSLRVQTGAVSGQPSYYGLNARNGTNEAHESWALNYTMTLRVQGGGSIRYRLYDSNCRQITNCGADTGSGNCGTDQRILTFAGADPMPMTAMLNQPYLGTATANGPGQWIFLDVTSVTVVP
jgi:hypothetical protein